MAVAKHILAALEASDNRMRTVEGNTFRIGDTVETAKGARFWGEIIAFDNDDAPRKTFPILSSGGQKIDWQLVADHAEQAQKNHYQSVERLAERGGLSWAELHAVLHNRPYQKMDKNDAIVACRALEARYLSAIVHPVQPGWRDGIALIAAERRRQIEEEGWSAERDDAYRKGELARAGGIYAVLAGADATNFRDAKDGYALADYLQNLVEHSWPWDKSWLKITSRQRALEKAGACIAAELDRLLRLPAAPQSNGGA